MLRFIILLLIILIGFNSNLLFWNEEFIVFLTLIILFILIYNNFIKIIRLFFFYRIEFIYFLFLTLIKTNKILISKIRILFELIKMNFISLNNFYIKFLYISHTSKFVIKLHKICNFIINSIFIEKINIKFFNKYWYLNKNLNSKIKFLVNFKKLLIK
jgi:hypothetical protein